MGLLTGKFSARSRLPDDDVRAAQPWVRYFTAGRPDPEWLARLGAVRDLLTGEGRTLDQGPRLGPGPQPGSRPDPRRQAGPLSTATMTEIESILNP